MNLMQHTSLFLLIWGITSTALFAQMWNGNDTLYGNEWIQYEQTYTKIPVAESGVYRLSYESLSELGLPIDGIPTNRIQVFHQGEEIPIYISSSNFMSNGDYIEFYGQKNRGALDQFLFEDAENQLLNPEYSLFTDTSAYYLTWLLADGLVQRYETIANEVNNPPAVETSFMREVSTVFSQQYFKKYARISGSTIYYSHFEIGEGFGSRSINQILASGSTTQDVQLTLNNLVQNGPNGTLEARFATGPGGHQQTIRINGSDPVYDEEFQGFQVQQVNAIVSSANLTENTLVQFEGLFDDRDEISLAYVKLRYPSSFHFENQNQFSFSLPASNVVRYLEIEDFNISGGAVVLYDYKNQVRLSGLVEDGKVKIMLPPSNTVRQLVLFNTQIGYHTSNELSQVQFIDYSDMDQSFVFIAHPLLQSDENGTNWVQEYANYRGSLAGGSHSTAIVDIQQIYEQFGYGVNRHSVSIRNFVHYLQKNWSSFRYAMLIGKGREYTDIRSSSGLESSDGVTFFIPSFGFPASDNLLIATPGTRTPIVPIGRLAATEPDEVRIYLEKVQAFEENVNNPQTIEDRAWMKQIIHLGGGSSASEQLSIKNNLVNMGEVLEENLFGADVFDFYKLTSDPIQNSVSDQIFQKINEGASLITFFGHSSPGAFDFNIDNPENYDNHGKFPLVLSLGCYSGNLFTSNKGVSERFVFYEDRAAIAFGASRGIGFISALSSFGRQYYTYLGSDYYDKGIGDALRATIEYYEFDNGLTLGTLKEQFTLHGDPSIKLHPRPGPDYLIDPTSVSFHPNIINAQLDSFDLNFEVINIGQNRLDSMTISVKQQLPGGEIREIRRQKVETSKFGSNQTFRLTNFGKEAVGLNTFFIELDVEEEIEELPAPAAEMNNELVRNTGAKGISLFIIDNTARPVYPPEFALVGAQGLTLKASTTDALAPERKYLLEIDTTSSFDSPLKRQKEIVQKGGVIKWTPSFTYMDSTTYYWRVSPDSTETGVGYTWSASSFMYVDDTPEGWAQGHYGQWKRSELKNMEVLPGEAFNFQFSLNSIRIKNKVFEDEAKPEFVFNGTSFSSPWPWLTEASIQLIVIDSLRGWWLLNEPSGLHGSVGSSNNYDVWAFDTATPEGRQSLMEFIENIIPEGHYAMLYSAQQNVNADYGASDWGQDSLTIGKNLFQVLEAQGASEVRQLNDFGSVPYVFMFWKGKGPLSEAVGSNIEDVVIAECNTSFRWSNGRMESPLIGPARKWSQIDISQSSFNDKDSITIKVFGIRADSLPSVILLEETLNPPFSQISLDAISATEFPFLKTQIQYFDEEERSPVEVEFLKVFYDKVPEFAVNPNVEYVFKSDTLQQGQLLQMAVNVENLSEEIADSLLVRFSISNIKNEEEEFLKFFKPLQGNDTLSASLQWDTRFLGGQYDLFVEINPDKNQPEQYLFNNFFLEQFFIKSDQKNPILDVTFDGIHIMNGDIIPTEPLIKISLEDENEFLLLSDTSLFNIYLVHPDGLSEIIRASDGRITFYPATNNQNNKANIEFQPKFLQEGEYRLAIRAKDASGNLSGQYDYEVSFRVYTQNSISNILNYPNPFSTSTQFVYTLTGEIPAFFKIQILTVSGQIIKEITQAELGELRIGTNRTDYTWDGTDEFGDRLANGVYLYRVVAKDQLGNNFETFRHAGMDGLDKYFLNGYGKLVILR